MTIYVDDLKDYEWKNRQWCHMMSDKSFEELHEFAARIGLNRSWYQAKSSPHYDLTKTKRALAIRYGAQPTDMHGMVRIIRLWRERLTK